MDFFLYPIPENSIVVQGIVYRFLGRKSKVFFSYPNLRFNINSDNKYITEYQLFHNGCPVAKLFLKELINDRNIKFNESISLNEDHLFVLEYFKHVENIILLSSINYNYRFDFFVESLTKRNHSYTNLMKVSNGFLKLIPTLLDRFSISNETYLRSLYTTCGINQMFKGMINYESKNDTPILFDERFKNFMELKQFISRFYFPPEKELKIAKFFVLNFNSTINRLFFFVLKKWFYYKKIFFRTLNIFFYNFQLLLYRNHNLK
jgi:hypothetical protein